MAKRYYKPSMMNQPKGGIANMPSKDEVKMFPEYPCGGYSDYDDTFQGADEKMRGDIKGLNRSRKPGNW